MDFSKRRQKYIIRKSNLVRRDALTKERFLTIGWNNLLMLGLGFLVLAYAAVALSTSVLSDIAAFIGLVLIGVVY